MTKTLTNIVNQCYLVVGNYKTVIFLDALKDLGFKMATSSGLSISVSDVLIPHEKDSILSSAFDKVGDIKNKFDRHVLTEVKGTIRLLMYGLTLKPYRPGYGK